MSGTPGPGGTPGGTPGAAPDPHADAAANRTAWAAMAEGYLEPGRQAWAAERPPSWGIWQIPEADVGALGDVAGLDVLDYGCGTGYWSAWLTRLGARVTAFDNSPEQLAACQRFQQEFGLSFPARLGSAGLLDPAEYPDASFDLILSEYAGMTWADPYRTIPECARLLRPGGRLVFLKTGILLDLCWPIGGPQAGEELVLDSFGLHRIVDPDDGSVCFDLPTGEWIRLFREHGLEVEALHELRPPADAPPSRHAFVTLEWARQWPAEEIWAVRKP